MKRLGSAAVAIAAVVSCGDQPSPLSPSSASGTGVNQTPKSMPAPTQPTTNFEITYMTGAIDHQQTAMLIAEACLEEAVHAELAALCEQILATHTAGIEEMQVWLADWYGGNYTPALTPGASRIIDRMRALEGAAFEIVFMDTMIRRFRTAIIDARRCPQRAYHDELKALCGNIADTQSAEIELMERWLCEWYRRCARSGRPPIENGDS